MRRFDEDRLSQAAEYADAQQAERDLERRLGVSVPGAWKLLGEIHSDLDPVSFGIGWWKTHLGDKRRILVADHLVKTTESLGEIWSKRAFTCWSILT